MRITTLVGNPLSRNRRMARRNNRIEKKTRRKLARRRAARHRPAALNSAPHFVKNPAFHDIEENDVTVAIDPAPGIDSQENNVTLAAAHQTAAAEALQAAENAAKAPGTKDQSNSSVAVTIGIVLGMCLAAVGLGFLLWTTLNHLFPDYDRRDHTTLLDAQEREWLDDKYDIQTGYGTFLVDGDILDDSGANVGDAVIVSWQDGEIEKIELDPERSSDDMDYSTSTCQGSDPSCSSYAAGEGSSFDMNQPTDSYSQSYEDTGSVSPAPYPYSVGTSEIVCAVLPASSSDTMLLITDAQTHVVDVNQIVFENIEDGDLVQVYATGGKSPDVMIESKYFASASYC